MDSTSGQLYETITRHLLFNFEEEELCPIGKSKTFEMFMETETDLFISGSVAEQGIPGHPPPPPHLLDFDLMFDYQGYHLNRDEQNAVLRSVPNQPGHVTINVTNHGLQPYFESLALTVEHERQIYVSATRARQKMALLMQLGGNLIKPVNDYQPDSGGASVPVRLSQSFGNSTDSKILEQETIDNWSSFNFDLVPTISCQQWPEIAEEWLREGRNWPSWELVLEIFMDGYHLVPKSSPDGNHDLEWRISFSKAELKLAQNLSTVQRHCFYIFKTICKEYLSFVNYLSSYHLKTLMLWACEQRPKQFWQQENIGACVLGLLDELLQHVVTKNLPHYFIPSNNLLGRMSDTVVLDVARGIHFLRTNILSIINRQEPLQDENIFHPTKPLTRSFLAGHRARFISAIFDRSSDLVQEESSRLSALLQSTLSEKQLPLGSSVNTSDDQLTSTSCTDSSRPSLGDTYQQNLRDMVAKMMPYQDAGDTIPEDALQNVALQGFPTLFRTVCQNMFNTRMPELLNDIMIPSRSDIQNANRNYMKQSPLLFEEDDMNHASDKLCEEAVGHQGETDAGIAELNRRARDIFKKMDPGTQKVMKDYDVKCRNIYAEVMTEVDELAHSDQVVTQKLLNDLRDMVLVLTEQTLGKAREEMSPILQDTLRKFEGCRLKDCKRALQDKLLGVISEEVHYK